MVYDFICFRKDEPFKSFPHVEMGGPPLTSESHAGYMRPMSKPPHLMPHISHISPSRLGQQSHQLNHGRPSTFRSNDWNHMKFQPPPSSFNSEGPRSPGSSSLNNGMPWGTS